MNATEWLDTDKPAVRADIARLGVREAARYNARLYRADRQTRKNEDLPRLTVADFAEALRDYH